MSIYPKNVSNGENVIIHLRFSNKIFQPQAIKYILSVLNSDNERVY